MVVASRTISVPYETWALAKRLAKTVKPRLTLRALITAALTEYAEAKKR